jgi:hypothetical protein
MNQRKSWMDKVMETILGNKDKNFQEILIERDVVDEIIQIARQSHPLEFVAMLEGKIKNGVLRIDGLVFSSGDRSNQGAVINTLMIPITTVLLVLCTVILAPMPPLQLQICNFLPKKVYSILLSPNHILKGV